MAMEHTKFGGRDFAFEPTPAVAESRTRSRYVDCSVCKADHSEYLFHRVGVRFVRCKSCGLVYVNPVGEPGPNFFDVARYGQHDAPAERHALTRDFEAFLREMLHAYQRNERRAPRRTVLLGRYLDEFRDLAAARDVGLHVIAVTDEEFSSLVDGDLRWLERRLDEAGPIDVLVLDEFLEATGAPGAALDLITKKLPPTTWYVVNYSNAQSMPARVLRRYWSRFFDHKRAFFSTGNLTALMAHYGLVIKAQFPYPTHMTMRYAIERVMPAAGQPIKALAQAPTGSLVLPARTGNRVAMFRRAPEVGAQKEKLSIVFPAYNEARYVAQVIDTLLAKPLPIERELIIVESNSTDGTRDIVRRYEGREGVRVLLEDAPRGKGHAVRTGLAAATGTIILIQDADFEYDIDDYDALLAPILQRRTSFVLGSRSLGLDDWKVRRFEGTPVKRFMLNAAQVAFAKTFNVLYQQRTTDVNTMYKVFRRECLEGIQLEGDRFTLDIELVCKLVKNGYAPVEVPVNYVARGFEEGKKISFVKDALPSYFAFFRYRFRE